VLLFLSLLALAMGPLLVALARRHAGSTVGIDSFCLVTVSGFALLHLLPEAAATAGWIVLPLALVGFVLPSVAERTLHRRADGNVRGAVLALALLGVAAHAILDGLLLAGDSTVIQHDGHPSHTQELTAWAIILHRIPEGVGIWWIVPRTLGTRAAIAVTLVSVAATTFGFLLGGQVLTDTSLRGLALLQSLLVGSLLHVVLHAHVPAPREQGRFRIASVLGGAVGVFVLWYVMRDHFPKGEHGGPMHVFVQLAIESAPALLFAYVLVGFCHAFLPANWLRSMTRGSNWTQALRGVAVGLPLPVCSCGVVPIYRELIRQGTGLAAAIAFLVATPELEIAAMMLTWQLMGGEVALARIGMAAVLALGVGVLVASLAKKQDQPPAAPGDDSLPVASTAGFGERVRTALRFGFGPAVDSTATWILMGLLLSAVLMPFIDRAAIAALPAGIDVPIAALLGLPLYVCATGSTPLAAMLLVQGLSPGAVLALMLTGPATNVTTFGVLAKLHGGRVAAVFAASMWVGAVALGYLANWLLPRPTIPVLVGEHSHYGTFGLVALGALTVVFLFALLRQGVRPFLERLFESPANVAHGDAGCGDPGHDHAHDHGHAHHRHGHAHAFVPTAAAPLQPPTRAADDGGCCDHRH
jgi:uncharacterized membrane protein YraQ (UPF0718 family)